MRHWLRKTDGVAAIEFGLVLPLLVIVLVGIMDYGQIHFTRLTMTNAAREGARVGVTLPEASAQTAAVASAKLYLARANLTAEVTATGPSTSDPTITITVTIDPYQPLIGLLPTPDRLTTSAAMRWELAPP